MRYAFIFLFVTLMACGASRAVSPSTVPAPAVGHAVGAERSATSDSGALPVRHLRYRGANVSGGEFGTAIPGTYGSDYEYPGTAQFAWVAQQGMNFIRLPFLHERLQPSSQGPINEAEWTRLNAAITQATAVGLTVELEAHNSFRFKGQIVSEVQIGDFWGRIGPRVSSNAKVWISPTNEPHDMTTEQVVLLDNASVRELRRVGFTGPVIVPGNAFTGAAHWTETWYGTSNAVAMQNVQDTASNIAFEVHLYLDADESGAGKECVSPTIGVERLTAFVTWLRANGKLGQVGEIGAPNTLTCKTAVTNAIAYLEQQQDVIVGWTWWDTGVWSGATNALSIGGPAGSRPQLAWIAPFLPCGPAPSGL